jgi:hypothetical protein
MLKKTIIWSACFYSCGVRIRPDALWLQSLLIFPQFAFFVDFQHIRFTIVLSGGSKLSLLGATKFPWYRHSNFWYPATLITVVLNFWHYLWTLICLLGKCQFPNFVFSVVVKGYILNALMARAWYFMFENSLSVTNGIDLKYDWSCLFRYTSNYHMWLDISMSLIFWGSFSPCDTHALKTTVRIILSNIFDRYP